MVNGVGQESMFRTALPYGVGMLAVGTAGVITAVASSSTAALVAGVALGILGGYGFYGVLSCSFRSNNTQEFKETIWKHISTAAAAGVADLIQFTIKTMVVELVRSFFQSRRDRQQTRL